MGGKGGGGGGGGGGEGGAWLKTRGGENIDKVRIELLTFTREMETLTSPLHLN